MLTIESAAAVGAGIWEFWDSGARDDQQALLRRSSDRSMLWNLAHILCGHATHVGPRLHIERIGRL